MITLFTTNYNLSRKRHQFKKMFSSFLRGSKVFDNINITSTFDCRHIVLNKTEIS